MLNKAFTVTFCTYFNSKPKFTYKNETYRDTVIFCVYTGSFSYRTGDGDEHIIKGGQAVICPPGVPFHRKMIEPTSFCMIRISTKTKISVPDVPVTFRNSSRFFENLDKLKTSHFVSNINENDYVNHFCRDIWYQITEEIEIQKPLQGIIDYINSNYTKNIRIEELACQAGYSVVHFINTFKKYYGYTPKQYIESLRIARAQSLIKTTELNFSEISALCGINDEFYFSRFFKKHCSITPKDFRKLNRI